MHLRIAGFTIELAPRERDLTLALAPATARFTIDAAPPDVRVEIASGDLSNDGAREILFDSGGSWRMFRHDDGCLFRFVSSAFGPTPYKIARWREDFASGEIVLDPSFLARSGPVDPLEYPLDELLVINLLGQGRGLEVHGCGVIDSSGDGYLFVGQSGAGKTTMARLWRNEPGTVILSDDRIVLRAEDDGLWMYGTPWHGDEPLASPRRARLTRLFFLCQQMSHETAAISTAAAAARLFAASFPPFHSARALEFSLGFIERVVEHVPCRVLGFAPTPSVISVVRSVLDN